MKEIWDFLFDSEFYGYDRLVRDKSPYKIIRTEDKSTIIHNVVGLGKDDINIEIKPHDSKYSEIEITGETVSGEYKVKSRFTVKHNDIDRIEKEVKNGILKLDVYWKQYEKPNIDIIDK